MYFEFEKQHDDPLRAKWRFLGMGAFALLLLMALSVRSIIPSIEKDLLEQVSAAFVENNFENILISTSGRDIRLEGLVKSSDYEKILEVANSIAGIRRVENKLTLIDGVPADRKAPSGGR